ncbi:hypothetical protein IKB17_02845 [bacterium]|nr:hypothetical protein [bacterium]
MIECVSYPNQMRNYCLFDPKRIKEKKDFNAIKETLNNSKSKDEILESLCALNLMLDEDCKNIELARDLYPVLAKYNSTRDPNLQTYLAGIYRKIKVPDAFGPLCVMLVQNALNPHEECFFDPNEEIGGAILDYLA